MVQVKITHIDSDLREALQGLAKATGDLKPALRGMGEFLMESTQDRIKAGGPGPDGKPWAPLSPAYLLVKKGPGTLRESGQLMDTIHWQLIGDTGVAVGSSKVYAAIQQLGGTVKHKARTQENAHRDDGRFMSKRSAKRRKTVYQISLSHIGAHATTIPARPFLGVSNRDREVLLAKLQAYLRASLGKGRS